MKYDAIAAVGSVVRTVGHFWAGEVKTPSGYLGLGVVKNPKCRDRARLLQVYKASMDRGEVVQYELGSHMAKFLKLARRPKRAWFCSELAAWTLAFAGGLNTDYNKGALCPQLQKHNATIDAHMADWVVTNLNPSPAAVKRMDIWGLKLNLRCAGEVPYIETPQRSKRSSERISKRSGDPGVVTARELK